MKHKRVLAVAELLLGGGFVIAQAPEVTRTAALSFGEGDQKVYVGAAAFQPRVGSVGHYLSVIDGYMYSGANDGMFFIAPLTLPAGAQIYSLCLYAYDTNATEVVNSALYVAKLVPAGVAPGFVHIPGTLNSTSWDFGYGVACTDLATPYTFHETADVDGDGNLDHLAHILAVNLHGSDQGFGGVGVYWRRQVSPAPAAASFADVPTTHDFFRFIEALAASGITAGCGGGDFCPDAPLTRGQMAVFLAKALGLHWPY